VKHPAGFEDVLVFGFEDRRVGVGAPVHPEDAVFGPVVHQGRKVREFVVADAALHALLPVSGFLLRRQFSNSSRRDEKKRRRTRARRL